MPPPCFGSSWKKASVYAQTMTNSLSFENTPASSPQMTWVAIKSISAQVKEGWQGGGGDSWTLVIV